MAMFRKNYIPKLEIRKSSITGKWFAYIEGEWGNTSFVESEYSYDLLWGCEPTEYDTVDDLMKAIYDCARVSHLKAIHENLTYNQVKVRL